MEYVRFRFSSGSEFLQCNGHGSSLPDDLIRIISLMLKCVSYRLEEYRWTRSWVDRAQCNVQVGTRPKEVWHKLGNGTASRLQACCNTSSDSCRGALA